MGQRAANDEFRERLEIALSGGGFRAAAFGLGVLLYLADSGLNRQVVTIASVSGGSITSGFVASQCDFQMADAEAFRNVACRLARIISGKGKLRGFRLISWPYLLFLAVSGLIILAWFTDMFVALAAQLLWHRELRTVLPGEMISFAVVAMLWGVVALSRGALVLSWISRVFFGGKQITLGSLSGLSIDHVFCATDLTCSCPFFFSTKGGGRLFSDIHGRGEGQDVPLKIAVAASAAFPPLIPPIRLKLRGRHFPVGKTAPDFIYVSDGGVWNNLGTDWSRLSGSSSAAELDWSNGQHSSAEEALENCPAAAGVLVIANASKPDSRRALWKLKVPVVSFVTTLLRVLDVAVNSTVRARSDDIERNGALTMLNDPNRWELGKDVPRPQHRIWGDGQPLAVAVEMVRKPGETATAYKMIGGLPQWNQRPDEYKRDLEGPLRQLEPLLGGDEVVPTTLGNLGPLDSLRMIVLGYLNTRETFAVAFANHSPPPIPSRESFEKLVAN